MADKERLNQLCWKLEKMLDENKDVLDRTGNYRPTFNLRWAFKIGEATVDPGLMQFVKQGYKGFLKHPFKEIGVCIKPVEDRLEGFCRGDEELYDVMNKVYTIACMLFRIIDPDYVKGCFTVNFSCMDKQSHYVGKHKDRKDVTYQYLLGLGSYSGAWIRTCGMDINYRHKIIRMDGRLDHEVVKHHFKGTRYSIIAYKNYDKRIIEPTPILLKPKVVFEMVPEVILPKLVETVVDSDEDPTEVIFPKRVKMEVDSDKNSNYEDPKPERSKLEVDSEDDH